MRNLLLSLIVICALFLISIYLFLPSKIVFSKVIVINTKINIANRFLMDESKWRKWFPSDSVSNLPSDKNAFLYKNYFFSLEKQMMNAAAVSISGNQTLLKSQITMISLNGDSVAIEWKSEMPESFNPFKKLKYYTEAKELQNNMADILKDLQTFLSKQENVYGISLNIIISKDSTLIATKCVTANYPSTSDIYRLISNLKTYIISQEAKENNFPMLHVKKVSDTTFETMVAIPVNKHLEGNGKIFFKRFVPWKVLTAEVKGGTYTVNEALKQMEIYIADYQKEAMAIPFSSLVTDRSMEPDTLKWITRIYTPIR